MAKLNSSRIYGNLIVDSTINGVGLTSGSNTFTLTSGSATLVRSGAHALTLTTSGATNVTFPTSGTLATTAGLDTKLNLSGGNMTGLLVSRSTTGVMAVNTQGVPGFEVFTTGANAAYMTFHRSGSYAVRFGLDTDNQLKVGGWSLGNIAHTLWHAGNLTNLNQLTNGPGYVTTSGVTSVSAGTQIDGMGMTITNGTTTASIATSITNAANFRSAIGAGTGNGTVTGVTATSPIVSSGGTAPDISHANSGVTAGSYNNVTVNVTGHVTAGSTVAYLTAHPTITTTSDTTSTASPAFGGTFTAIDGVTRDANGHVTTLNTKTVTLPANPNTDTLNTAGSNQSTSKLFLVGPTSQTTGSSGLQTFSNSTVYTTNGTLFAPTFAGGEASGGNLTIRSTSNATKGTITLDSAVTISGDLTINGTTTTLNSTTLTVDDKNIELGSVASPTDTTANGGGITLKGTTDKTITWDSTNSNWTLSEHLNIPTGKLFKINNATVLSGTALGSGVTGSSLTSVGTIGTGTWQGTIISPTYGGTGVNNATRTLTVSSNNFTVNSVSAARTLTLNRSFTFSGDNDRTLTINNADKTLAGAATVLTFGGNFTHTGAHTLGLTTGGNTSVTLPTSGTLYGTATGSITSAQLATSISDETGSGALVFATSPTFTTGVVGGATFNVFDTTSTTINAFGAATTLNLGHDGTSASTTNIATGATVSGSTKTINIGTGGVAGSLTNVNIGSLNDIVERAFTLTDGSVVITGTNTANIVAGQSINGPGVPNDTTVVSVVASTSVTMSNPASASGLQTLKFGGTKVTIAGALDVIGNTTLRGKLTVEEDANFKANVNINGSLDVKESITAGSVSSNLSAVQDNKLFLRFGATESLGENEFAGLVAVKADGVRNSAFLFDGSGNSRVGDIQSWIQYAIEDVPSASTVTITSDAFFGLTAIHFVNITPVDLGFGQGDGIKINSEHPLGGLIYNFFNNGLYEFFTFQLNMNGTADALFTLVTTGSGSYGTYAGLSGKSFIFDNRTSSARLYKITSVPGTNATGYTTSAYIDGQQIYRRYLTDIYRAAVQPSGAAQWLLHKPSATIENSITPPDELQEVERTSSITSYAGTFNSRVITATANSTFVTELRVGDIIRVSNAGQSTATGQANRKKLNGLFIVLSKPTSTTFTFEINSPFLSTATYSTDIGSTFWLKSYYIKDNVSPIQYWEYSLDDSQPLTTRMENSQMITHGVTYWNGGTAEKRIETSEDMKFFENKLGVGMSIYRTNLTAANYPNPLGRLDLRTNYSQASGALKEVAGTVFSTGSILENTNDKVWQLAEISAYAAAGVNNASYNGTNGTGTLNGGLLFKTKNANTSVSDVPTTKMVLNSAGNLGIGITNPIYRLDVSGDVNITGNFRVNGTVFASATNLGITNGTTAGPIVTSSTGTNATLPLASTSISGVLSTAAQTLGGEKTFANGIGAGSGTETWRLSSVSGTMSIIPVSGTTTTISSAGVVTATTFSGSGASLTSLPAGQLTGTIPSAVLGNSSLFIGTTSVALNRASATLALTGVTNTNWDAAYTHSQVTTGAVHGATTVGNSFFRLTNPSAVTFPRMNADNTVTALNAADFRTAIGAGTSSTVGTVTSVAGTGTVSGLTLTGTVTSSGNLTLGGTLSVAASNFSSQTANTFLAAPNGTAGVPTFRTIVSADVPTLNQNTTGTAANVTGTVAIANGGTGATTAAAARTGLGATTLGANLFTLTNVSAISFLRVNATNTVDRLSAADFRTAIGAGTSSTTGTVTSVAAGAGLNFTTFTTSGTVAMGTPSTLTASTSNSASGTTHTHAITTTTTGANSTIVATDSSGTITASTFNATSLTDGGFQGIAEDSATQPSHTWTGDLDTGMYRVGVDQLGFTAGGTSRLTISSTQAYVIPTTASTSTSTGALRVDGGVGIGGALYAGGITRLTNTTASTTTATGALVVSGGVGIAGALYAGGLTRLTNTTASTTTATGALVVSGGVGIAGALYVGGQVSYIPTTLATTGTVSIDFAGASTRTQAALTGNITYTGTGYAAGRNVTIRVINGTTQRTLTFPAGWVFLGTKPANIAASKTGVLSLTCFGTVEADVIAAWGVQS